MSASVGPAVRLALRPEEAAAALGVSADFFAEHIASELPWVRRGRLKFVPIVAVETWLAREASRVVDEVAR